MIFPMKIPWFPPETRVSTSRGSAKATVQRVVSSQLLEAGIDPEQVSVVGHVAATGWWWDRSWMCNT